MIETPQEILCREASTGAVNGFMAWRNAIKKPLTDRAAAMIAKTLRTITGAGGDADEALDLAQEHGWRTIKPDWYWSVKNGTQIARNANAAYTGPDAATRAIAIAGTARRTSSGDCF